LKAFLIKLPLTVLMVIGALMLFGGITDVPYPGSKLLSPGVLVLGGLGLLFGPWVAMRFIFGRGRTEPPLEPPAA